MIKLYSICAGGLRGRQFGFDIRLPRLRGEEWQIDPFKRIDLAGMDLWMRNWCNQHPTQKVVDGALEFIHEMLTNAAARR